jgi:hypothetical protein
MDLALGGKRLDVRVSTLPARGGERVVLRLLDKENAGIDLAALGSTDRTGNAPLVVELIGSSLGATIAGHRPSGDGVAAVSRPFSIEARQSFTMFGMTVMKPGSPPARRGSHRPRHPEC